MYMGDICRRSNRAAHKQQQQQQPAHTHTAPFEKALISMPGLKCVQERGINYKLYK